MATMAAAADNDDDDKEQNDLFGDSSSSEDDNDDNNATSSNKSKPAAKSNAKKDDASDEDEDEDTDDLIAAAKSQPIARKKSASAAASSTSTTTGKRSTRATRGESIPDADNDEEDDDDYAAGLFDSSSEDEAYAPSSKKSASTASGKKTLGKKRKASTSSAKAKSASIKKASGGETGGEGGAKDTRSMKERMEALARKRAAASSGGDDEKGSSSSSARKKKGDDGGEPRKKRSKDGTDGDGKEDGYDSGDSYDSATFTRTKDDDDFIDADDEDPDSLRELYAEQHFGDERPDGEDSDDEARKKKKATTAKKSLGGGGLDKISLSDDEDENGTATSALKAAVRRMQKVKKEVKKLPELEEMGTAFLKKMEEAASADEASIKAKKPGLKKLAMLQEVTDMLSKKDMIRVLLDLDLLSICKRWIQPLSNGSLGNVTLRRRIVECTIAMTGEDGINATDLKNSGYGKVIMALYTHKSETPEMKKMLRGAIEQWSRPIFQKSGNLRDLERVHNSSAAMTYDAGSSLAGMMKSRSGSGSGNTTAPRLSSGSGAGGGGTVRGKNEDDLDRIINSGATSARDLGNNRVRVPYSKGFQYTVRPESRKGDVSDKRNLVSAKAASSTGGSVSAAEAEKRREALSKRMEAKSKKTNKMANRSANISIEGRAVK